MLNQAWVEAKTDGLFLWLQIDRVFLPISTAPISLQPHYPDLFWCQCRCVINHFGNGVLGAVCREAVQAQQNGRASWAVLNSVRR